MLIEVFIDFLKKHLDAIERCTGEERFGSAHCGKLCASAGEIL